MRKGIIWYPTIIGFLVCLMYILFSPGGLFDEVVFKKADFFANTSLTASITILGFLIAIITFIISASDAPVMQYIIHKNGDKQLWQYFSQPFISGLLCIIFSILLSVLVDKNNYVLKFSVASFIFANSALFISIIQTARMIVLILKQIIIDKKTKPPIEESTQEEFFKNE